MSQFGSHKITNSSKQCALLSVVFVYWNVLSAIESSAMLKALSVNRAPKSAKMSAFCNLFLGIVV